MVVRVFCTGAITFEERTLVDMFQPFKHLLLIPFKVIIIMGFDGERKVPFSQILFQQGQVTAGLQIAVGHQQVFASTSKLIFYEWNVVSIFLKHILCYSKRLVGLYARLLSPSNSAIYPVVGFIV